MCTITDVQITGQNPDSTGVPLSYELDFRISGCERVDIEVLDVANGTVVYQQSSVPVSGPVDQNGLRLVVIQFTPSQSKRKACGDKYHVVITCALGPECKFEDDITIVCKRGGTKPPSPCSNTATLTATDSNGNGVLGQSCVAPGSYTIQVLNPWSPTAQAMWSVAAMPHSGGSITSSLIPGANGRTLLYTLPDMLQPADTERLFSVTIFDTTPSGAPCNSQGTALLPAVRPKPCPTNVTLELSLNGVPVPAGPGSTSNVVTYPNLTAGHYKLSVTDPVDTDTTYDWYTGNAAAQQTGPSNFFEFDLAAANSPRQIDVFIEAGACCPTLHGTATLTVAAGTATTPTDTPTQPPPTNTPTSPPSTLSLCGIIRALLALALVVFFVSILFILCPSPLTPIAVATATTAAAAVAVLLALAFLLCRIGFCGFWGIVIWALQWATIIGVIAVIILLAVAGVSALPTVMCVLLTALGYGIVCGLLTVWVTGRGCTIPACRSWP
jgi:hypothetical protein